MARGILTDAEKKFINYEILDKEIARLNRIKADLIRQTNEQNQKLSDLKEEEIALNKKADEVVENAKEEAKRIIAKAKDSEDRVAKQSADTGIKLTEAEKLNKEARDLIKSN